MELNYKSVARFLKMETDPRKYFVASSDLTSTTDEELIIAEFSKETFGAMSKGYLIKASVIARKIARKKQECDHTPVCLQFQPHLV